MKAFVFLLFFIGCASAATVESIKSDLKKLAISYRDTIVDDLQSVLGLQYDFAKTLNSFFSKPQLGSSSKAFDAVVAYINGVRTDDKILTAMLDSQLNEYRTKIDSLLASAVETVQSSECKSKVLSSLSKFSKALQTKVKDAAKALKKNREAFAKGDLELLKKSASDYEASVKFCTKPANVKDLQCVTLEPLSVRGPKFAESYKGIVDSFIKTYLTQAAGAITWVENMENDFDEALNIECESTSGSS